MSSGGYASGVSAGGPGDTVFDTGIISAAAIGSGDEAYVFSGGVFAGGSLHSGALLSMTDPDAVISGLTIQAGATIELDFATNAGGYHLSFNSATDVLKVNNATGETYTLQLAGSYANETFSVGQFDYETAGVFLAAASAGVVRDTDSAFVARNPVATAAGSAAAAGPAAFMPVHGGDFQPMNLLPHLA